MTRLNAWRVVFGSSVILVSAAFLIASTAQDSLASASDVVVIPWGDPGLVQGDELSIIGPAWCGGAARQGGVWVPHVDGAPLPAWVAEETDTNTACLLIRLNRAMLTNDLRMDVTLATSPGAVVRVDLLDSQGAVVGTAPVAELTAPLQTAALSTTLLPLTDTPAATVIRLRREGGGVIVYNTVLAPAASIGAAPVAQPLSGSTNAPGRASTDLAPADETSFSDVMAAAAAAAPEERAAADEFDGTNGVVLGSSSATVIYVDAVQGNDANSGRRGLVSAVALRLQPGTTTTVSAVDGPKATIRAGLAIATGQDRVEIRSGDYAERLNIAGRNVKVRIDGVVNLRRAPRAMAPASDLGLSTNALDLVVGGQTNGMETGEARQ